jgi:lambda repressor-like predicted transcriptional regulator
MSRIGKKPISIPEKTEVTVSGGLVTVKGPQGTISRPFKSNIDIVVNGKEVILTPKSESLENKALWGTYGSHITNMIAGVNTPFVKKLILEGIGYKSEVKGTNLVLALGFSHPVNAEQFRSVAKKNLLTMLREQTGPQTDKDANNAEATYVSLGNTPQANQFILDFAEAMSNMKERKAQYYQEALPYARQGNDLTQIDRRGFSLVRLASEYGITPTSLRVTLARKRPVVKADFVIASFLEVPLHELWPDRYDNKGNRLVPITTKGLTRRRKPPHAKAA